MSWRKITYCLDLHWSLIYQGSIIYTIPGAEWKGCFSKHDGPSDRATDHSAMWTNNMGRSDGPYADWKSPAGFWKGGGVWVWPSSMLTAIARPSRGVRGHPFHYNVLLCFCFVPSISFLFLDDKGGGFHAPWIPGNKLGIWCRSAFIVVVSEIVMIRDSAP